MPFSSGTYSLPSGNPVVTGTTISSSTTNTTNSDIATALSSCILKDGTQTVTANIPMASHKITGLAAGTTAGDSVEYGGSPKFAAVSVAGSTSGTVTLQAPAVSGSTVLTLPAQTGTVMVNGPAFSAYLSANQAVTSSVFTKLQCNTEEFDTNSNYDNATNYRFTPTVAGYYQVTGAIAFDAGVSKVEFLITIYKNGSEFKRGNYIGINTVNSENLNVSSLIYLNGSTDYIEIYGYLNGVGSPSFGGSNIKSYFQAFLARSA